MKILAIETASESCSVALLIENEVSVRFEHAPRKHAQLVLPMVDTLLNQAGITLSGVDAIAFGCGPGAFTGLRIAAGITQGLALSVDVPVIPISTLAALAQQGAVQSHARNHQDLHLIAALDARMEEVYWGEYQLRQGQVPELVESIAVEQVDAPEKMLERIQARTVTIGIGWDVYAEKLFGEMTRQNDIEHIAGVLPSAQYIAHLAAPRYKTGNVRPAEDAQPVYIRNKVANKSVEKRTAKHTKAHQK